MAQTIADLNIPNDDYVDINSLSGIDVGTSMEIMNKGSVEIYLQEGNSKPSADSTDGIILTDVFTPRSTVTVTSGSLTIWAKVASSTLVNGKLNVQEL